MTDINERQIQQLAEGLPPSSIGLDYEEVVTWLAKALAQRDAQIAALTAENVALMNRISWPQEQCPTTGAVTDVDPADFLPATDAAANALRAEGLEMLAEQCEGYALNHVYTHTKLHAKEFANQLREGKA